MSRQRTAELALVCIAAVWGLTFVMVQDAIERLPAMTFLAYRFIPAGLIVAAVFWRSLRRLPPEGWRAGLVMGVFLTAGYVAQTLGLEHTSASNAGFITGLFVVLTPLFGALLFGDAEDYLAFMRVVREAKQRFGLRILAYVIMPNHWHLIVWPDTNLQLSRFMHWLTPRTSICS